MKLFSKKESHNSKIKYKIGSAVLCAALIFSGLGGVLPSVSALNAEPFSEESVEQPAEDSATVTESSESDSIDNAPTDAETSDSAAAEIKPSDANPSESEPAKPENTEPGDTDSEEKDLVYTLHLTHYLRFTVDGENRHIQTEQTIKLTEKDFEDGQCDLSRFAYDAKQLMVTEAKPVSLDDFDKDRQGGARIVYAVNSGWKLVPT